MREVGFGIGDEVFVEYVGVCRVEEVFHPRDGERAYMLSHNGALFYEEEKAVKTKAEAGK